MNKIVKYMGKSPNSPVTLRALVDGHQAHRIIGSGGNVHQYIQTTCEVKLYLHNDGDRYGRLCSIAGPVKNVARAWREIILIIFNKAAQGLMKKIWLRLLIPSELAWKLNHTPAKSTSGCQLYEIAKNSATHIVINPSPILNTTEHILDLSVAVDESYLENFTKALVLIGRKFQIYRHEALSPNNIYYTPFCSERPPILDDDDEDVEEENVGSFSGNHGQRQQQQRQQQYKTVRSQNKDKGVATFVTHPTIAESSMTASKSTIPRSSSRAESSTAASKSSTIAESSTAASKSTTASYRHSSTASSSSSPSPLFASPISIHYQH